MQRLIAGPGVYVCNECLAICEEILRDDALMSPPARKISRDAVPSGKTCLLCHYLPEEAGDFILIPHRGLLCLPCADLIKSALNEVEEQS